MGSISERHFDQRVVSGTGHEDGILALNMTAARSHTPVRMQGAHHGRVCMSGVVERSNQGWERRPTHSRS